MKKRLNPSVAIGLLLVIGMCLPAFAQTFPYCTDTPEYCQKKVAQVPIPWQFWGIRTDEFGNTTVIDRIRISPTWLNPPPGHPPGAGSVFIRRMVAVAPLPIPLEELVWNFDSNVPVPDLIWEVVDETPIEVMADQDIELEIPVTPSDGAVLVAYEVFLDTLVVGHFINEAILESQSPQSIVEIMVNFDIHNSTGFDVTNFELEFLGLDFGCDDVRGAVGFIAAEGVPPVRIIPPVIWGANEGNPLVVHPVTGGTEVKWIQPDRPLTDCKWLHVGLVFDCTNFDCFNNPPDPLLRATVQGYWTVIEPCPEIELSVDIKPGSCPNPLNLNKGRVVPVVVLGTEDFDVTTVDLTSMQLSRDGVEGYEVPLRWALGDVATPFEGQLCDCHDLNGDGYLDLKLKFHRKDLVMTLKLWQVLGQNVPLTLTGKLKEEFGGTEITGEDCLKVRPRVKGRASLVPIETSGVYGKARLVSRANGTTRIVLKDFTGLTPGETYTARIRDGGCDGAILFTLNDVIVDDEGVARSVTVLNATIDFDTWWIEVGGVTCGEVKLR